LLIRRALLTTVAGASLFWILFGALDVPAAAAGVTSHVDGAAPAVSSRSNQSGDEPGHHCHGRGYGDRGDRDPCCQQHCCRRAPSPRPHESAEPTAKPTATSASTPQPKRAATPAPHNQSPPVPVVGPRPGGIITSHPSPVPSRGEEPASGSRLPVLSPPELTIPAVTPLVASGSGGVGAVAVIALSTVLVAAAVAAVSLVLMRRSG
jgi:hypothetical protein